MGTHLAFEERPAGAVGASQSEAGWFSGKPSLSRAGITVSTGFGGDWKEERIISHDVTAFT